MEQSLENVLKILYDEEINCSISSFWDRGWEVKLGDDINGFKTERDFLSEEFEEIAPWLLRQAKALYPGAKL